jgi:Asp-tRNA(Asn)/Glu-tRNA(Gln) amidotransferase A subunit family amidase
MSQHPLRERLDQMRAEIARAAAAEPTNETLRTLHQQTLDALAEIDRSGDQGGSTEFQPGLPAAIKDFEASHPSLTLAMMRVMDVLNGIGL